MTSGVDAARNGAEVLVVGGGLIGSLCALRLRDAGLRVTLLERSQPGREASSAAGGILAAQLESHAPGPMFDLMHRSRGLFPALAEELRSRTGFDIGWRRTGSLEVFQREEDLQRHREMLRWQSERGHTVQWLDARSLRDLEPMTNETIHGGVHFPDDARVDPVRLTAAVLRAGGLAGVIVRTGIETRSISLQQGRVTGVETDDGHFRAEHVVVAAGAWSSLLAGTGLATRTVRPVRGQMVELATSGLMTQLNRVIFGAGGYVVPRDDGTVLCGSTLEHVGYAKAVTAEGLSNILRSACQIVPALREAEVLRTWSGLRPASPDNAPLVGTRVGGLTLATGHYRSGIVLAPVTAEIVCNRIVHGDTTSQPASWDPWRASTRVAEGTA